MKIAIYGAGAIGAFLGARLSEGGADVALIARGAHLEAIQHDGLRIDSEDFGEKTYRLAASDDPAAIGPVDYVILGVKAHGLTAIAPSIGPLLGDSTAIVSSQNGLPWWYFYGVEGDNSRIEAVDPGGVIAEHLPPERAIGSIVYISCGLAAPGVVRHTHGARLPMGEPNGDRTERIKALSEAFRGGGVKAPIRGDIRHELWAKLLGNAIFNPLSALTRKTMIEMLDDERACELIRAAMTEVRETAAAAGVQIAFSPDQRIVGARAAGFHKTSMLQDLEAGKQPELEPLTGAVIELARRYHVEVPYLEAVYAAAALLFKEPVQRNGFTD